MFTPGLTGLKRAAVVLPVAYTGAWLVYYGEACFWANTGLSAV